MHASCVLLADTFNASCIGVEQILTGRKLFKQLFLGVADSPSVLNAPLGLRGGFLARNDLSVVELVNNVIHCGILLQIIVAFD